MATASPASVSASLARENLSFSYAPRTKAFTTRMATRFSCTVSLSPSILRCMASNSLMLTIISSTMASPITGMTARSTPARATLMEAVITSAAIISAGARASIRRPMVTSCCMVFTSLVMRVISEAEENRSISEKENSCILSNIAPRRLAPKPRPLMAANLAESTPQTMANTASTSISAPFFKI
ncbi:hypothetical protein SDC9_110598 [bioreactor metagenome]|uniref:Uncharacterized protein n=1 Tax=bioreactor metagenome TaxID=1076179 RepID=A0A645BF30_9ZZZZ